MTSDGNLYFRNQSLSLDLNNYNNYGKTPRFYKVLYRNLTSTNLKLNCQTVLTTKTTTPTTVQFMY
jgi:hypothetical protein